MNRKNRQFSIRFELILLIVIMALAAYLILAKTRELETRKQDAIAKEQMLEKQIREEQSRTEELKEKKTYVKTDEYIEEVARDKLGLINPDEVLFKEKEGD